VPEYPEPPISSESDSAALAPLLAGFSRFDGPAREEPVRGRCAQSVEESLRERSPGVWQVRTSPGREPATKRYRYASATVQVSRREPQRKAAGLVVEVAEGKIPLERAAVVGHVDRLLEHIEALGTRFPDPARETPDGGVITKEVGAKQLRKLRGRDLEGFYVAFRLRGLSATSVRRYHTFLYTSLNQAVEWRLIEHSPIAQATPPAMKRKDSVHRCTAS
jgi:hypothetical protein